MMNNKIIFDKFIDRIDRKRLFRNTEMLWQAELPQTFPAFHAAAKQILKMIKDAGIPNAETVEFPADGVTTYQDKRMPLAWDATIGKLTILSSPLVFPDPAIADYRRHPFHLIRGSVATPPEGRKVRIITEKMFLAGESPAECLVLAEPDAPPRPQVLSKVLDGGGYGMITDHQRNTRNETPDAIFWSNSFTEGENWHVSCDDRPFLGFSISPRNGDLLRKAISQGQVTALAECDGQRYRGILPGVTALLPGRRKEELWIIAHLYEPLSDDNATGVSCAVEIAQTIKSMIAAGELPPLEFSIRLVFASELYGFAAFADRFGGCLRDKTIGAINLDSLPGGNPGEQFNPQLAPPGTPFFGNSILEAWANEYCGNPPVAGIIKPGNYGDDTFLSDSSTGLPTVWTRSANKKFWHHSNLTMDMIDIGVLSTICAFAGTWAASVSTLNHSFLNETVSNAGKLALQHLRDEYLLIDEILKKMEFRPGTNVEKEIRERMSYRRRIESAQLADFRKVVDVPAIERTIAALEFENSRLVRQLCDNITTPVMTGCPGIWFEKAAAVVPTRATLGLPYDMVNIPKPERKPMPDRIIYGPFARILANMDGTKTLQRLIREAEWETQSIFTEEEIKDYCEAVTHLAKYKYLDIVIREPVKNLVIK